MSKIKIYQFTLYDISIDAARKSRRWATREAIGQLGGTVMEHSEAEVDPWVLGSEVGGMTEKDFDPG
jgi:hypothetical protein